LIKKKPTMDKCRVISNLLLQTSFVPPKMDYEFHLYFSSFLSILNHLKAIKKFARTHILSNVIDLISINKVSNN